jgi:hypothetical protein
VTTDQIRAYRACVNAYVDLLMDRNGPALIIAYGRMLQAFGYSAFSRIPAELCWRFQCSFRRMGEQIARSDGWDGEDWFSGLDYTEMAR